MTEHAPVADGGSGASSQPSTPRAEHRRLQIFVGTWRTEGEIVTDPAAPTARLQATDTYEWLAGEYFLLHRVDGRMGDDVVQALEVIGYDADRGAYFTHAFDNQGNAVAYEASLRGPAWSIAGPSERFTGIFSEDGTRLTGTWERFVEGAGWTHWMTMSLTKTA